MSDDDRPYITLDELRKRREQKAANGGGLSGLKAWLVTRDNLTVGPREWLLGNVFCRKFVSSLIGAGGVGKTALRYAQYISGAIGRPLTGEFVFKRFRTLIISLEDGDEELRRRLLAVLINHDIAGDDLGDWLYATSLTRSEGQIMVRDEFGQPSAGSLGTAIGEIVKHHEIDLVAIDPLVKSHGLDENSNGEMDQVVSALSDLAVSLNIAVDVPDHISKSSRSDGEITGGRGASAKVDAMRLVYSLKAMTRPEAEEMGVEERERVHLIRVDPTKINLAPPPESAVWFKLVSVALGNGTADYPSGDHIQTAVPWKPGGLFEELPVPVINLILDDIAAGHPEGGRYSDNNAAKKHAAFKVVQKHAPEIGDRRARKIIDTWVKSGVLFNGPNDNPKVNGRGAWMLFVDNSRRPGNQG